MPHSDSPRTAGLEPDRDLASADRELAPANLAPATRDLATADRELAPANHAPATRDLASDAPWTLSLERTRRRRALAAERHLRAPGAAKGTAAAVSAALLVSPGLALASAISPRTAAQ
ncbi:MAG: hypothetical protein QOJ89_3687, partial [bacterium]